MREHLVITHFDLRKFPTKVTLLDKSHKQNKEWLEHRIALFDRWCFPSVSTQLILDFKWLICLDANTPPWVIQRFEEYRAKFNNISILLVPRNQVKDIKERYRKYISPGTTQLITTRLDSDDAIHESFVERVQQNNPTKKSVLYFNRGYIHCRGDFYKVERRGNHYLSFYEPYDESLPYTSCYAAHHRDMLGYGVRLENNSDRMWIEVHHELNLFNKLFYNTTKLESMEAIDFPSGFNV